MKVQFQKVDPLATITRAHSGDAGADLCTMKDLVIRPGEVVKVNTGIAVRSGLCCKAGQGSAHGRYGIFGRDCGADGTGSRSGSG